jgi:hypothetical protein
MTSRYLLIACRSALTAGLDHIIVLDTAAAPQSPLSANDPSSPLGRRIPIATTWGAHQRENHFRYGITEVLGWMMFRGWVAYEHPATVGVDETSDIILVKDVEIE